MELNRTGYSWSSTMSRGRLYRLRDRPALRAFLVALLLFMWPGRGFADGDIEAQLQDIRATWFSVAESTKPFSSKYTDRHYQAEATQPMKPAMADSSSPDSRPCATGSGLMSGVAKSACTADCRG
jgi:hypothetical protein